MRFELYTDSKRKENIVAVQQALDYSARATKLSKASDNQLKLYVIAMLQRWEAVSEHLIDLEKQKPGLYPSGVNIDINSAQNLGHETYSHISVILDKNDTHRDYEELARHLEDFERHRRVYASEVKKAERLLLTMSPVVPLQNSPDSSKEPRVSPQVISSNTTSMPVQPSKETEQAKAKMSFLTKFRDEQSGSADPDYMAKQEKKQAKRHAR